jgi:purine nucleosidase
VDAPLILDVDTGVDDALAIGLALARDANLIGVTTVAGNVPVEVATRNSLDVLAWLGREDIPVHRGASRPLVATYQDATHVHGGNGLGGWTPPMSSSPEAFLAGPAFILQRAERYAGELVLVTLGPLTNLAIALNVRPQIVEQIAQVVVMGGAYFTSGNITPHAEFNVYVDPDAAAQVVAAAWNDITLIGLDVTHQTAFPRAAWESVPNDADGATGMVQRLMSRTFTERDMPGFYLHDPLAVAVALDGSLVAGELAEVTVATQGDERGKTSALRAKPGPMVATQVDAGRFLSEFGDLFGVAGAEGGQGLERAE